MHSNKHLRGLWQRASCLVRAEALQPHSSILSPALWRTISFCRRKHAPYPLCFPAVPLYSGQLFSICILCRFTLRALHLYYKCWIPLAVQGPAKQSGPRFGSAHLGKVWPSWFALGADITYIYWYVYILYICINVYIHSEISNGTWSLALLLLLTLDAGQLLMMQQCIHIPAILARCKSCCSAVTKLCSCTLSVSASWSFLGW